MFKKIISVALAVFVASHVFAPAHAVEITVHHAPGGPSDKIARYLHKSLDSKGYLVVNRPGAAGRPAVKHVMSSNSVLVATVAQIYVSNPITFKDLDYNPNTDLDILAVVAQMPNMLTCRAQLGFTTLSDVINTTKSLNFGVNGYGSSEHIATEALFKKLKGKHLAVPYPNAGNRNVMDLLGGTIDCIFSNYPNIKPFLNDSRVSILFSSHDLGVNVPNWQSYFKEPFPYNSTIALVVAKKMDQELKNKIVADFKEVFDSNSFKEDVLQIGLNPIGKTDSSSIARVYKNNVELRRFIEANNIKTN